MTAAHDRGEHGSRIAVATSQQGWGEALASLLASRNVQAVAVDPAGREWHEREATDPAGDADRWTPLIVDAADPAAPEILARVRATVRVALSDDPRPALDGVDVWVDPHDPGQLVTAARDPRAAARQPSRRNGGRRGDLTARERAVLALLREGLSNAEVAHRLDLSPHTARTHVQNILSKLGAANRFEAAVMANGAVNVGANGAPPQNGASTHTVSANGSFR